LTQANSPKKGKHMAQDQNVDKLSSSSGPARKLTRREKPKQDASMIHVPTLKLTGYVSENEAISTTSMEFHMTIQPKISNLTQKQLSMLLSVGCVRSLVRGVDFTLYLVLEYLYFRLKKSGLDPLYEKDIKVRHTLLVAELILSHIEGTWFDFTEVEEIPNHVIMKVVESNWLPSNRTIDSWKQHWDLEKYLQVRIVPVETAMGRDKSSLAERYSGYTKGYGNDGSPMQPGKTKPTRELDGEDSEEQIPVIPLFELETYNTILFEIESAKARKRQNK